MQIKRLELSESEAAVMRCVWEHNGINGREIREMLKDKYGLIYAPNTIYTIIDHLKDKGYLIKKKSLGVMEFYPNVEHKIYLYGLMQKICDDWFNGDWSEMADWLKDKVV